MKVVQTKVADLRCSPDNPRKITKARLEQLQRSLQAEPDMLKARPVIALHHADCATQRNTKKAGPAT